MTQSNSSPSFITLTAIPLSELFRVAASENPEALAEFSEDSPFTWGTNSHSLVRLDAAADHIEERFCRSQYWKKIARRIRRLSKAHPNVFLDLEN